jgi:hypothetical protein
VGSDGAPIEGPTASFTAFPASSTSGVRVAEADFNLDGFPDVIAGAGPGAGTDVRMFDGRTGQLLAAGTIPLSGSNGVFVAGGDVDADGRADLVVGNGSGAPRVQVYSIATGARILTLTPYAAAFTGGVRVAAGDVNGDGWADIITAPGAGTRTVVKVFNGLTRSEMGAVEAYPGFTGGLFVATGDVNGDGRSDVITGAGAGGPSTIRVFSGRDGSELQSIHVGEGFSGGVRVAAGDVDFDGRADIIASSGSGANVVRVFSGVSGARIGSEITLSGDPNGLFISTNVAENRLVIETPSDGATVPPSFRISGYALQEGSPGTGVSGVYVFARRLPFGLPVFVGPATMGDERPDVAERFGDRFLGSGYHLDINGALPGEYDIFVAATNSATGFPNARRTGRVRVAPR